MSDAPAGAGWWQAPDGRWYPPAPAGPYGQPPYGPPPYGPPPAGQPPYGQPPYGQPPYGPPPAGQPPYGPPPGWTPAAATSGLAIASLVLAIVWLGGIGSVLGVVFGIVALSQIRASQGRTGGSGMAIAGISIGAVGVLATIGLAISLAFIGNTVAKVFSPTQLRLGQAATYPTVTGATGLSSISVVSFSTTTILGTPVAYAGVRECAGPLGAPAGDVSTFGWSLVLRDGVDLQPGLDLKSPSLGAVGALAPDRCVTGYLAFALAEGSAAPAWVEYDGTFVYPYEWAVGG